MERVKPMIMQAAEPEYMCPKCGAKFYVWSKDQKPYFCHGCGVEFDWGIKDIQEAFEIIKTIDDGFWNYPNNTPASPCDQCSNHPKNGGNGICWCTLGTPKITC